MLLKFVEYTIIYRKYALCLWLDSKKYYLDKLKGNALTSSITYETGAVYSVRHKTHIRVLNGRALYFALSKKKANVVYSGHALSYKKLVHRHATQTEGNKYFK